MYTYCVCIYLFALYLHHELLFAVPFVSLEGAAIEAFENDTAIIVTLTRTGHVAIPATVNIQTMQLTGEGVAIGM